MKHENTKCARIRNIEVAVVHDGIDLLIERLQNLLYYSFDPVDERRVPGSARFQEMLFELNRNLFSKSRHNEVSCRHDVAITDNLNVARKSADLPESRVEQGSTEASWHKSPKCLNFTRE